MVIKYNFHNLHELAIFPNNSSTLKHGKYSVYRIKNPGLKRRIKSSKSPKRKEPYPPNSEATLKLSWIESRKKFGQPGTTPTALLPEEAPRCWRQRASCNNTCTRSTIHTHYISQKVCMLNSFASHSCSRKFSTWKRTWTLWEKQSPTKVTRSKLGIRDWRPECTDQIWSFVETTLMRGLTIAFFRIVFQSYTKPSSFHSLQKEIDDIQRQVERMQKVLKETENQHQRLLRTRNTLEHDLALKMDAMHIDREKVSGLRRAYPVNALFRF